MRHDRNRRYSNIDLEIAMLEEDLLEEDDDVEYRRICAKLDALLELKGKELENENKRKTLGEWVSKDALLSAGVSLLTFGSFMAFEKVDPVTLKNTARFLNPFRKN